MSVVLLDTHALVWLVMGDERLRPVVRRRIEAAAQQQQLWVSAITPWEAGMLVAKARLVLDRDVMDWLQAALALPGIRIAPLEPVVAVAGARLPGNVHGDPADRLIVATYPPPGCSAGHGRHRLVGLWPTRACAAAVGAVAATAAQGPRRGNSGSGWNARPQVSV